MTPRLRLVLAALLLLGSVIAIWSLNQPDPKRSGKQAARDRAGAVEGVEEPEPEPDDPRDPDEREPFDAALDPPPAPAAEPAAAGPTPPTAASPTAAPSTRVGQLHDLVLREAVQKDWITMDEGGTPCPRDRVRIVYDVPGNLRQYVKGAYFEPLGPAPEESSNEVNGLLICEGSTFLYRGFEAYWRPDSGRWDVFPFPVIE